MAARLVWISLLAAGNSRATEQLIPLPATLNQEDVGQLNASVDDDQLRSLDITPIRSRLEELLSWEQYLRLQTNASILLPPAALEAAGIQVRFSFENLSVQLTIPTALRRLQNLNLIGNLNLTAARTIEPSEFSAFMNLRGGVNYVESSKLTPLGFDRPQVAFENAFNFRGLVLENETEINPAPDKTWEKRDTRLIWDQPDQRIRWTLGDLNYPVTSFQGFLPMLGLSMNRQDSLQPYRVTSPLGQSAFFLKADSKVEIIINGHTVQTLQMSAGPHQISNFPLTGGANNVTLRITDPVGRIEYINATMFYDPGLLKAGESEFNYALGFPSLSDPGSPIYHYDDHPAASAYHRWGITDRLTAGLNAQATQVTQQGGLEAILSTVAGTFDFESAFTHDRNTGIGNAQRLQYRYYVSHDSLFSDGTFSLSVQRQSPNYTPPNALSTSITQTETWDFEARYSQRITERLSAGIGYLRQMAGGETILETYSLATGYHWRRIQADLNLEHNQGASHREEWTAFLSVVINFAHGHSVYSSYDSSTRTGRTEWQYIPPSNVETINTTLGVQAAPSQNDLHGNIQYIGRRAELSLSQDTQSPGDSRASLRWGTALVYAGGQFAVSRPIIDSFALIDSTGSLRQDGGVGVQPQAQRFVAQEDWLGPAVLPQITSYYPTRLAVVPRNPQADLDPQAGDLLFRPIYHSGTHVRLGQAGTISVIATLRWADGKPAALQSGTITAGNGKSMEFISNREGVAFFSELKAGTYSATLAAHPESSFSITVPPTAGRELNLGDITVPVTP